MLLHDLSEKARYDHLEGDVDGLLLTQHSQRQEQLLYIGSL